MLKSISPIDGRYYWKTKELWEFFSEYSLIKYRVLVEVEFFKFLWEKINLKITEKEVKCLNWLVENFDEKSAERIKEIEKTTNHDVKAVEYFLKENLEKVSIKNLEFIHFACTSEDINNLSYSLMLRDWISEIISPAFEEMIDTFDKMAEKYSWVSMLSRTHGQPASPTTIWKELKIFEWRFRREFVNIKGQEFLWKLNWASWNFNAHSIAYPEIDWAEFSADFVESLWLTWNAFTNQIEPHDYNAEIFDNWSRVSTILIDFNKDIWTYISLWFFKQKTITWEIWSSAMPHKVNPIDFENSEWNCGMAIAIFQHLARKLPISRMQRDLTDSTVLRNIWVWFAYLLISIKSTMKWISKLELNEEKIAKDLDWTWEVLAEAIQTVMRKNWVEKPYEKLKELTRWKKVNKEVMQKFLEWIDLPKADKERLKNLTPATYIWIAKELAESEWEY